MAKRGQGEGSISKRDDGTWWARVTLGKDENGKQKRKAFYGKTRKEVQEKLTEALSHINNNSYIEPSKMTVSQWLDIWSKEYKKRSLRPSSYSRQQSVIKCIVSELGNHKINDLRTDTLQKFVNTLYDKNYSVNTIRKTHGVISSALKQATENALINKNPALVVKLPTAKNKTDIRVLTIEEQKAFIEIAKTSICGDLFIFMLATGLRLGEAIALTWDDIDFENKTVSVNKTAVYCPDPDIEQMRRHKLTIGAPKTVSSEREVPLLPTIVEMLINKKEKLRVYNNIFTNVFGEMLIPDTARRNFKIISGKAQITNISPHILRHTFATRGLENGIELKVMQEFLGHSSIKMTADIYTHVLPDKKNESINKLSNLFNL